MDRGTTFFQPEGPQDLLTVIDRGLPCLKSNLQIPSANDTLSHGVTLCLAPRSYSSFSSALFLHHTKARGATSISITGKSIEKKATDLSKRSVAQILYQKRFFFVFIEKSYHNGDATKMDE